MDRSYVVVGGSGFLGSAVVGHAIAAGHRVVSVDAHRPGDSRVEHLQVDLLSDDVELPPGDVILVAGSSRPRVRHPWTLALDNAVATARLLPQLAGRRVTLASSVETLGRRPRPELSPRSPGGLPIPDDELRAWCARMAALAVEACPPWRVAGACRELVDPSGRWTYGLAKRAQELLVNENSRAAQVRVVRLANLFGPGQDRIISRWAKRAEIGLPLHVTATTRCFVPVDRAARALLEADGHGTTQCLGSPVALPRVAELVQQSLRTGVAVHVRPPPDDDVDAAALAARADHSPDAVAALEDAIRQFARMVARTAPTDVAPIGVVVPPRPRRPDVLAHRQQTILWSGQVKDGRWSGELTTALRAELRLDDSRDLLLCASGTAALRLAVAATLGAAAPGDVAVLPSFTFPATAEALIQLGYRLRFVDVDPATWTMDPAALERALATGGARAVMCVDTLGAPVDYDALNSVCAAAGVPLLADSAPALGSRYLGVPVAGQAAAHAYSMSFAKVVSAGGTGGALVLPADRTHALRAPVDWLRSAQLGEMSAVTALDQVHRLDELVAHRAEVAAVYAEFAATRADIVPQVVRPGDRHSWVHWVARFTDVDRAELQLELAALGVASKPYYAPALHRHDWAGHAEPAHDLPVTAALDQEALALPMSSELTGEDAERVVGALVSALAAARPRRAVSRDRPTHHAWPGHARGAAAPSTRNPAVG